MADAGYDVSDYRDIDPVFGTLADAEGLMREAHAAGIRVILDIVPNHTSSEHAWFQAALAGDSAARARYCSVPAAARSATSRPTTGAASSAARRGRGSSTQTAAPATGTSTCSRRGQPDLDWSNPEVRGEFEDILRFWFDRGVDGFRIDVAHGLAKHPGLPDADARRQSHVGPVAHPAWDQDEVHEIYRGWRKVADSYEEPRIFVAEAWVADNERLARYVRPDELHSAFQFDFLQAPFRATAMRRVVDDALAAAASRSCAPRRGCSVQPRRRPPRDAVRPLAARRHGRETAERARWATRSRPTSSWARGERARPRC